MMMMVAPTCDLALTPAVPPDPEHAVRSKKLAVMRARVQKMPKVRSAMGASRGRLQRDTMAEGPGVCDTAATSVRCSPRLHVG